MMKCEFEEKQFEKLIDAELFSWGRLFPVGQVFEGVTGFDSAGFVFNRRFWRRFPSRFFPWWRPGILPDPHFWDIVGKEINSDAFPRFKCNVFLQYKRPQYLKYGGKQEFSYWKAPHYRYYIDQKQQGILERLEQQVSSKALVLYACPAFWKFEDLWKHAQRRRMVDNTNFCKPAGISGHGRYTFIDAKTKGKAFSEPEDIEPVNFKGELDKLLKQEGEYASNKDFILKLERSLSELYPSIEEAHGIDIEVAIKDMDDEYPSGLGKALIKINLFTFLTGLSWMIGCDEHE